MTKKSAPSTAKSRIVLRELSAKEIPSIFPLIHLHNARVTKPRFTARLKDMLPYGYHVVAAFDGNKMVGISGFWLRARFWCGKQLDIDNFFVHPDYRKSGIGKQLVEWLETRALKEKCDLIVLDAYADSFLAHRFYHARGFVATGTHFTKVPGTTEPFVRQR